MFFALLEGGWESCYVILVLCVYNLQMRPQAT